MLTCLGQFTSSNLPIVIINTNGQVILDDPKISADLGIISNTTGGRNLVTDAWNHYSGKVGIEIRGQSSQQFPMKSYSIELQKADGSSNNKSLFGLPVESDWVLYAPYNDKTLMHNFLAYTISREMGDWAANCRYVELLVNGEYKGIYVFMEKIKRKAGRVNISSISNTDTSGDALTGGYIISIDKEADGWFSNYKAGNGNVQFSYVYPKIDKINNQQKAYIKNYTDSFEYSLHSNSFQDKNTGWRRFADEKTFIDYFIVNELSHNVDAYRLSSYFYKDRNTIDGKLKAGPVWDYDLAFRNANYCDGSNTNGWAYKFNSVCPGDFWQVPAWWDILLSDTAFRSNLYCRWKELRQTSLSTDRLTFLIDSVAALTSEARERHFAQWPVLGQYIWPNPLPIPTSYEGEISLLKNWLGQRLAWLDDNIQRTGICAGYPENEEPSFMINSLENPIFANTHLIIQSRESQSLTMVIIDMNGRKVGEYYLDVYQGVSSYALPAFKWPIGIYALQLFNKKGEKLTRKFLKK